MTVPNPDRPAMRRDLTRWNRTGLSRFQYVDGDAAVWLEELRLALLGLYLRGEPVAERLPEAWRDVFLNPVEDWPDAARQAALAARVSWSRLMPARPPNVETRGQRGQRLIAQYAAPPAGDHAWEIARAFARAAHVHLGHLEAFAGEGYLRTATQWDNLRRLAAMVNYQPGPPASASTVVALDLVASAGVTTIAKGLSAKFTPAAGGAPLIFETLEQVIAHPDLNAARVAGWNVNAGTLPLGGLASPAAISWTTGPKTKLSAGDLVVIAQDKKAIARQIVTAVPGEGQTTVTLDEGYDIIRDNSIDDQVTFRMSETRLWHAPGDVRTGEPQTATDRIVMDLPGGLAVTAGDVVMLNDNPHGTTGTFAEVLTVKGSMLILRAEGPTTGIHYIRPLVPIAADAQGWVLTGPNETEVWFTGPRGISSVTTASGGANVRRGTGGVNWEFHAPGSATKKGFVKTGMPTGSLSGIRPPAPEVVPGRGPTAAFTVSFPGKPPKSLAVGSWFVAREIATGYIRALRVEGVSTTTDAWHILFDAMTGIGPDKTEFHGPLTEALPPVGFNRNPDPLGTDNSADLSPVPEDAQLLLKPGRRLILSRPAIPGAITEALATLTAVTRIPATVTATGTTPAHALITFTPDTDTSLWPKGDTSFRLNVATLGYGESKGPRLLGSGDAERPLQSFTLPVKDISHIASTAALAGVVPDVDVAVDGVVWPWRDYTDVTAEGAKAWSSALTETGEITVHFRRRLPTGTNNVSILRHRVGTGLKATGLPSMIFDKPMKKHPQVIAIHQPFSTSGGSDRESVASLRTATPARLSANGRAVSARDFERLAMGHASIWRARSVEVQDGAALRTLHLTLVSANGATLTTALKEELRPMILANALPGVRLTFDDFTPLYLRLGAAVRADLTSFDTSDVKAACEAALLRAFGLERRDFAQPAYVSEIMAVLETVPQVETAVVTAFALEPGPDTPANTIERDGAIAAIFPKPDQIAFAAAPGQPGAQGTITVTVRGLT